MRTNYLIRKATETAVDNFKSMSWEEFKRTAQEIYHSTQECLDADAVLAARCAKLLAR